MSTDKAAPIHRFLAPNLLGEAGRPFPLMKADDRAALLHDVVGQNDVIQPLKERTGLLQVVTTHGKTKNR